MGRSARRGRTGRATGRGDVSRATCEYELTVCVQRWSWWPASWPFGKRWSSWRKRSTKADVKAMCALLREAGAFYAEFEVIRGSLREDEAA